MLLDISTVGWWCTPLPVWLDPLQTGLSGCLYCRGRYAFGFARCRPVCPDAFIAGVTYFAHLQSFLRSVWAPVPQEKLDVSRMRASGYSGLKALRVCVGHHLVSATTTYDTHTHDRAWARLHAGLPHTHTYTRSCSGSAERQVDGHHRTTRLADGPT